ncbi:MAG: UPF0182 family protein, partial [Acidobacteriaceae bacterium]|nr:UPF0182 family protein [Acidobacteriaceae bacterium]
MNHIPELPRIEGARSRRAGCFTLAIIALLVLFGAQFIASFIIDYQWWQEMGQLRTWWDTWLYRYGPVAIAALLMFVVLWIAHARALKHAGTGLRQYPTYAKLATVVLLLVSWILAAATIDSWTVVKFFGGQALARQPNGWHDPVFQKPLGFYLFDVPFFSVLLSFVLALVAVAAVLFWVASRFWQLQRTVSDWSEVQHVSLAHFDLSGLLDSGFVRLL